MRKHLPTVLIAMVVAAVTAGAPAIAHGVKHAVFAHNASKIDNIDSKKLSRSGGRVAGTFSDSLALTVPGYGKFVLYCSDNGTPTTPNDDLVTYGSGHELGSGAWQGQQAAFASSPTSAGEVKMHNIPAPENFSSISTQNDRVQVDEYLRSANGKKVIRVSAWAQEDSTSTTDCLGMIEAQILR